MNYILKLLCYRNRSNTLDRSERVGGYRFPRSNEVLCQICNYDWRVPRLTHTERGCCPGGPSETNQKILAALCNSNVLLGGHGHLPSKHRIGSTTAANADQVGGIALRDLLPRCVFKSFASLVRALPAAGADDDSRAMVNK